MPTAAPPTSAAWQSALVLPLCTTRSTLSDPSLPTPRFLSDNVPYFGSLSARAVEILAGRLTHRACSDTDIVWRQGDPGDRMFVVLEGVAAALVNPDAAAAPDSVLEDAARAAGTPAGACVG